MTNSILRFSLLRRALFSLPVTDHLLTLLRDTLISTLKLGPIPRHVAFVMDGNRRFAREHEIETVEGHNLGFEALAKILEVCYKTGVRVVTIYAFSIENFKRSKYEVDALMDMARVKLVQMAQHGDLCDRYGASIRVLGQRSLMKQEVIDAIEQAEAITRHNTRAILNVCFPYTSRDEMTSAMRDTVAEYTTLMECQTNDRRPFSERSIMSKISEKRSLLSDETNATQRTTCDYDACLDIVPLHSKPDTLPPTPPDLSDSSLPLPTSTQRLSTTGSRLSEHKTAFLNPNLINNQSIDDHLFTAGCPPLDLLIRTSGVERLSDFMLWQCHKDTSVVFLKCLWPEFDLWQFLPVLVEWQWWRRRSILVQGPRT